MPTPKSALEKYVKKDLDIIITTIIDRSAPIWGYEIIRKIRENFGVLLSSGTLYPILHDLEDQDYISGHQEFGEIAGPLGRIEYSITPEGKEFLEVSKRAKTEVWRIIENLSRH
jgi:DNA-binding PadR family transcriptional regulator